MESRPPLIHLDTHVVVWLYHGRTDLFPKVAQTLLRGSSRPLISPMVRLELAFLNEIGRLHDPAAAVLETLRVDIDLGPAESPFERVAAMASGLSWTRDPFDRLIAAHALADDLWLITRDRAMLEHCRVARWGG